MYKVVLNFFVALFLLIPAGQAQEFKIFRALASSKQNDEAIRVMMPKTLANQDADTRMLANFALGVLYFESGKDPEAQRHLFEALNLGLKLEDYISYFLAESFRRQGNIKEAKREYQKVLVYRPISQRYLDARMALGELAISEKEWREAHNHFIYLEKKMRRTPKYASVVLNLIKSDYNTRNQYRACKWMRKLYTQYPGDNLVTKWSLDLHKTDLDGIKPNCIASPEDIKTRIRNLQHAGLSQKAREEIEVLRKRSGETKNYYADSILANFLVNDGHVEEAFKILVPFYEAKKSDYSYLMLLAKASSRAAEFQTAAGAYYRAYQLTPGSRKGREALFQAAFLSYQNQDYDGAATRFNDFLKKFSRSGLSRDAKWYLAWISYLKSEYGTAYDKFTELRTGKYGRRSRMTYSNDRIDYWRAMSLMKEGKLEQATVLFENVAKDNLLGYYAISAKTRLVGLREELSKRKLAALVEAEKEATQKVGDFSAAAKEAMALSDPPPVADAATGEEPQTVVQTEEDEAESGIQVEAEEPSEDVASTDPTEANVPEDDGDNIQKTSFKDPRLIARFKRANQLAVLGFYDWAKWELWEIEKRTRNKEYLKMLMTEYEMNFAYNRSSAIAQDDFGTMRARQGLDKAKFMWQFAYPKAFDKTVSNWSRSFRINQEIIWSIMRAESRYKPDVASPVGALGLMQLMPYTADAIAKILQIEGFTTNLLLDPEMNIRLGSRYLARLSQKLNGQIPLIAAAYNAGPHRVAAWLKAFGRLEMDEFIEHIPFFETRNYVKKVVHNYYIYSNIYSREPTKTLNWLAQPIGVSFDGPVPTKEDWSDI